MCSRALDAQQSIMELTTTMRNFRPIEVNKRTETVRVVLTTPHFVVFSSPSHSPRMMLLVHLISLVTLLGLASADHLVSIPLRVSL